MRTDRQQINTEIEISTQLYKLRTWAKTLPVPTYLV